jgi:glutamate-1-semialdehyde aminotransferase
MFLAGVAAVALGVIVTLATLGVGIPVSVWAGATAFALISGSLAIAYSTTVTENPTSVTWAASVIVDTATQEMYNYRDQLSSYLDQLVQQGKISSSDKDTIMNYVNSIIGTAISSMQQLRNLVNNAYKQGQYSMIPWIIVAFVGGTLVGTMLQRIPPAPAPAR